MSTALANSELVPGLDFRQPEYRREVFLRFYRFHLRYRTHPGCVYFLMPYLRNLYDWDDEQYAWFCFLNGNTQNPVTSLRIMLEAPTVAAWATARDFVQAHYKKLEWDTDRRYHKSKFGHAAGAYFELTDMMGQQKFWAQARCWDEVWRLANAIPTFGRLSSWSYLEYLYLAGFQPYDADTLMLEDRSGSKSHRNGLCIVSGRDQYDWHHSNPGFDGCYPDGFVEELAYYGETLLGETARRWPELKPTRLTLESALCTYKSWHRPRRRYPNVYADMHHDRIVRYRAAWGEDAVTEVMWAARKARLPAALRLEHNPYDPGVHPDKQDWYRTTGEVIMMDYDDPVFSNGFSQAVALGRWGLCR